MTVKDILEKENSKSPGTVILFKEGIFLKAYERSAHVLASRFGFKTKKIFVKVVGQEVVSVGFPETSLSHYFPEAVVGNGIVTVSMDAEDADFEQWKRALSGSSAGCVPLKDRAEAADIVLSRIF